MMSGGQLHTLSKILGHKDLEMTQRYAKLSSQFIDGERDRMDTIWTPAQFPIQLPRAKHPLSTCSDSGLVAWGGWTRTNTVLINSGNFNVQDVRNVHCVQQIALGGHKLLRAFSLADWTPEWTPY
jgi:hypothetical protein